MAIAERGEVEITIDGEVFTMVPTMRVVSEIERAVCGIVPLSCKLVDMTYTNTEIATVIAVSLKDKKGPSVEEILQSIHEEGVLNFTPAVTTFVLNCLGGSKNLEKAGKEASDKSGKQEATTD